MTPVAHGNVTSDIFPAKQKGKEKKPPNFPIHEKTEENIYALCPVKRLLPYLERLSGQEHHGMDRSLLN